MNQSLPSSSSSFARPWDKKRPSVAVPLARQKQPAVDATIAYHDHVPRIGIPNGLTQEHDKHDEDSCTTAVTYFYSDRFYLNTSVFDQNDDNNHNNNNHHKNGNQRTPTTRCTCGAANSNSTPPTPLLSRRRLVESLQLSAAILGTYTCGSDDWLAQEYPSLFGGGGGGNSSNSSSSSPATVPTLVLHGRRRYHYQTGTNTDDNKVGGDDSKPESQDSSSYPSVEETQTATTVLGVELKEATSFFSTENEPNHCSFTTDQDDCSLLTQAEIKKEVKNQEAPLVTLSRAENCTPSFILPSTVHFTQVLSTWIRPCDLPSSPPIQDDGTVSSLVVERRQGKKGVYHPKFMILMETSGSVVVVVSTANLVEERSFDATWVQRFFPASQPTSSAIPQPSSHRTTTTTTTVASNMGVVLANFLHSQTLACQTGQLTPLGFVQRYLGWNSLLELADRYDFTTAQVDLIPMVPGDYNVRQPPLPSPPSALESKTRPRSAESSTDGLYGRQRVAALLERYSTGRTSSSSDSHRPWIPDWLLSDEDRLVLQPTSIGSDWTVRNLSHVVRSYLGQEQSQQQEESEESDADLLNRLDIVWPTEDYMRQVIRQQQEQQQHLGKDSPNTIVSTTSMRLEGFACKNDGEGEGGDDDVEVERENGGHLFLSSETFNKIDLDCLSRMVMYEPSIPHQRHANMLVPHFKSVARLFQGSDYRLRKEYGCGKCQEIFSWFMLTSACLSRGAQGDLTKMSDQNDAISYANFELGVLFCSRLQGKRQTDRLFCFHPAQCSCSNSSKRPSSSRALVHLPAPFCMRPARYLEDEDDVEFCETPYFHEIPQGTASVGNMRMTPIGAALAAKCAAEGPTMSAVDCFTHNGRNGRF